MPDLTPQMLSEQAFYERADVLTERRKADRIVMARHVAALAISLGAQATIVDKPYGDLSPQEIAVKIEAARGLCLTVDFDGRSCQPDVHVLSWHMSTDSDACLADKFCPGSINLCHFRKATDIAHSFERLCGVLQRRLPMAADGSAFDAERERRGIAENGSAAERAARFQAWRDAEAQVA